MRSALVLAFALAAAACSADGDAIGTQEGELGAEPIAAGIAEGSLDEEGVLVSVNDAKTTAATLETQAGLPAAVATAITTFRTSTRFFESVDEIDALAGTDADVFRKLVIHAKETGATEAPGFDALDKVRLRLPDGFHGRPTSADIVVEAGFDGLSAEDVRLRVRGRLRGTVHPSNDRFVDQTIAQTLHAFTIGVNNLFASGSPHATFARALDADRLTLVGTMSSVSPTFLVAEKGGTTTWYTRQSGEYVPTPAPKYPLVMRARVRLGDAPGVRVFYPSWKAKVLAAPTGEVIEGGG